MTLEGIVDSGRIRLKGDVRLPEHTEVYVIVPGVQVQGAARIMTPRLVHPAQAGEFELEVIEEAGDASVWDQYTP